MSTRMQQRRGTAAQWISTNSGNGPILAAGEIGFESDTNKFKIGDGVNHWIDLTYFTDAESALAAVNSLIDGAPDALNTLNELAAALNDNPNFFSTVATNLSNHESDTTNIHGITDTANLATKTYVLTEGEAIITEHNESTTNVHGITDASNLVYTADERLSDERNPIDDSVTTEKILNGAVTTLKIEDVAVTTEKIADAAITAVKIADNNVTEEKINASAVTEAKIASGAVTELKIGNSAVVSTKIASEAIVDSHISSIAAIAQSKINGLVDDLADKASVSDLSAHASDTTSVHGIADTSALALTATVATDISTAISTHASETISVHGIADTADLLLKSGGTMTGALTLSDNPSSSLHAATKQYVDNTASGVVAKPQVLAATSTNLNVTYDNGTLGVGATLTATTNGAWPTTVAGATGWAIGKGLLVKSQTNKAHNGRYYLSDLGSVSTPWVLTRCGYCDEANEIPGAYIFVQAGTLAGTGWIQTVADPSTFVVGTDDISVYQFSGSGTITAGTNVSVNGNEISVVNAPTFSGAVTASSGIVFSDGTQTKIGVPSITTFATAISSSATLAAGEADKFVPLTGAVTITLPATGYSKGQSIDFYQESGTGAQFASTNSVVGTPGLKFRTTNSVATAMKTDSGWLVFGDLSA
jgi:hypothetical protein